MTNNFVIASKNNTRVALWKQALNEFVSTVVTDNELDLLLDDVVRIKPEVLLLDLDLLRLNSLNGIALLRKLCTETKIIVLGDVISEELEWELLKAGVRGCCQHQIKSELLKHVAVAVQEGELWIRRTLTGRLVDELGQTTSKNKAYRASLGLLNKLTQREYDIAVHVGNGKCNKQIAQLCGISERTVKAHLSEVFQKLGITDRLNLALLIFSADNKNALANFDIAVSGNLAPHSQDYSEERKNILVGEIEKNRMTFQEIETARQMAPSIE
jgi:DNA-binding NarL/FixJ family response regulator